MRIAIINIPLREPENSKEWIPLPPKGYGGIQWVVTNLLEGYLDLGHRIWLLGAPSTTLSHRKLTVVQAAEPEEIADWLKTHIISLKIDVIHDHSNGVFQKEGLTFACPLVRTHHLTGKPVKGCHPVYLSEAQREQAGDPNACIIRIPINTAHYRYSQSKENYLLYLGRISPWKGAYQAAQFAHYAGLKLILAGPAWEKNYLEEILKSFPDNVEYVGEVGGEKRIRLLSQAKAVMALSQPVLGPWGNQWCEPGSTIVSEAAASGTPVIASTNGCLKEIAPHVGIVVDEQEALTSALCLKALSKLPLPQTVFSNAVTEWGYLKIAAQYLNYFQQLKGRTASIEGENMSIFAVPKEQLLIEGGTVAQAIVPPAIVENLDKVTMALIRSWEANKTQDPDFWWYHDQDKNRDILYRIHKLETKSPAIKELLGDERILELRDFIFGKPTKATAVALIYKDPKGSAAVPWHRDPIEVPPNTVYNFSIYLDESDEKNGGLEIVPGSHLYKEVPPGPHPENAKVIAAHPGDVTIHDVCVYHGSAGSLDGRMRRSIVVEFQPVDSP
jgi:hypothetical protein